MSRPGPDGGDLAGRWLPGFLTSHLAAERDLSPQTIASYRDAIRLLLTWFRDVQATPPERLRWSTRIFVDISIMLLLVPNCQIGARNPLGLSCRADVVSGRDCNIARCSRTRRS